MQMKKIIFSIFLAFLFLNLSAQQKFTDPRDGNTYRTISAGGTIWMAENLKYSANDKAAGGFDNNSDNIAAYGVLYDWKTAKTVCPDGWHLPSGEEFRSLMDQSEINHNSVNHNAGPSTFKVQLAGMQDYEGTFSELDESAYYWTSTEYTETEAEYFSYMVINDKPVIDLSRKADMPDIHGAEKSNKYSVRCVKNK
jgi:uncharacterized protein (TIGR02145 family)